jgi:hypothetical protein
VLVLAPAAALSAAAAAPPAESLADVAILVLAPGGQRAVVKSADGTLHLLSVGDPLPGTRARVVQVLADRLVVEETLEGPPARTRRVWLHDRRDARGKTIVQALDPLGPRAPERRALPSTKPER